MTHAPPANTTAVATQAATSRADHLDRFRTLLVGRQDPDRVLAIVSQISRKVQRKISDKGSLTAAVTAIASLGLDPESALGQAYIVPYKGVAKMILGYRGMITLAARAGVRVHAQLVREGDRYNSGTNTQGLWLDYRPLDPFARAEVRGAFAAFHIGDRLVGVSHVSWEDVADLRRDAKPDSAWALHPEAMLRKTAIRRGFPQLPLESAMLADLARLIRHDAEVEGEVMGTGPTVTQVHTVTEALDVVAGQWASGEREPGDDAEVEAAQ